MSADVSTCHSIITDEDLREGQRVAILDEGDGQLWMFVHRPSLLDDPESVMDEFIAHCDVAVGHLLKLESATA